MSLRFDELTITVDGTHHRVLVAVPVVPIVVGRQRLEAMRQRIELSAVDQEIIARVQAMDSLSAFVFRGTGPDGCSWRVADELTSLECTELGALLAESHLPIRRAMVEAGALDHIYIAWGEREIMCFETGLDRLRKHTDEQARREGWSTAASAQARLNLWTMDRNSFYSALTYQDVIDDLLPTRFRTRPQRLERYAELLREVRS